MVVGLGAGLLLIACCMLGGASRENELRLALVELLAIPCLALAILANAHHDSWRQHGFFLAILGGLVAIPLVQLLPLPPQVWMSLPGRDQAVLALEVTGTAPTWVPISLAPDFTWMAWLALIPPVAIALAGLVAPPVHQRLLVRLLLALTVASMALGAAQLVSGGEALYPWRTTDAGSVVGFFANRNHLATLCLMSLPFAAIAAAASDSDARRSHDTGRGMTGLWLGYMVLVVVIVGVIRSRAGILLLPPAVLAALAAGWIATGRGRPRPALLASIAAIGVAIATTVAIASGPIVARFGSTESPEIRFQTWPRILDQAQTVLPVGSGLGSFDAMYRSIEPLETLDPTFLNHAHNEYLEAWLETGWFGAALVLCFMVWYARRSWVAWRAGPSRERDLQRAASVAIAIALAHSLVDYPLRTVFLATVFALCCAVLEFSGHDRREARHRRLRGT